MNRRDVRIWAAFVLLSVCAICQAADPNWTATVRAQDIVAGQDLQKLGTRHKWAWRFDNGRFEVAVRKSAIPIPAPQCRMDYLVLTMPEYYPENPAKASAAERRAVYDALVNLKKAGAGAIRIRFNALWYWRQGRSGPELTACNIYFSLPLDKDSAKVLP